MHELVVYGRLSLRWLGGGSLLEHHRDAILHRVVATATGAMQPRMRSIRRPRNDRVMTYRANQHIEQSFGQNRDGHEFIVDANI